MRHFVLLLIAALVLGGCQFPRDPEGTLDRVRGGTLRVGISPSEPWVTLVEDEPPAGVEVELVQAGLDFSDTRILSENRKSRRPSAGEAEWTVPVPANGSAVVTAIFDTRY